MKLHLPSLLLATLVLAACAATGPDYGSVKSSIPALKSDQARLYFMRGGDFQFSWMMARVHLNSIKVLELNMGGFGYADVLAGKVNVVLDSPLIPAESTLAFDAKAGTIYYYRVGVNPFDDEEQRSAKEKAKAPGPKPTSQGLGAFALFRLSEGRALSELKTKKMERNLAR